MPDAWMGAAEGSFPQKLMAMLRAMAMTINMTEMLMSGPGAYP